jgi:hypothetical protein
MGRIMGGRRLSADNDELESLRAREENGLLGEERFGSPVGSRHYRWGFEESACPTCGDDVSIGA